MPVSDEVLFKAIWDKMFDKSPQEIGEIYAQLKIEISKADRQVAEQIAPDMPGGDAPVSGSDAWPVRFTQEDLIIDPQTAITDDEIICCLCGKGMGVLTKHLSTVHKLSPEQYIELCGYPKGQKLMSRRAAENALGRGGRRRSEDVPPMISEP